MNQVRELVTTHWFAAVLLAAALLPAALLGLLRQRRGTWAMPLVLLTPALALLGLGGLFAGPTLALWLAVGALVVLFVMLFVVVLTGHWWAPLGYAVAAVALVGAGGLCADAVGAGLAEAGSFVWNLRPL